MSIFRKRTPALQGVYPKPRFPPKREQSTAPSYHAAMGGDPKVNSSSSSKKEVASCVDMPKSWKVVEVVVVVVGDVDVRGGARRNNDKQGFLEAIVGLGGGPICLFDFRSTIFCGRFNGGGTRSDSGSILRIFAVLDSGPGRTEGGDLMTLVAATGFRASVVISACAGTSGNFGSSSRSSSEKSRSCVESGGIDSTTGNGFGVIFDV